MTATNSLIVFVFMENNKHFSFEIEKSFLTGSREVIKLKFLIPYAGIGPKD